MKLKRIILEMGTGNDLYGQDYTKAAVRAVQDALHHSSLTLFRSLEIDHGTMEVTVTVGVQQPDAVDSEAIKAQIPYGKVAVRSVHGGLDLRDPDNGIVSVIATVAVAAHVPLPEGRFRLA